MSQLITLLKKDLLLEVRLGETLVLMAGLALLMAIIVAAGISSAMLPIKSVVRIFPALCWIIFVFVATIAMTRNFVAEQEHNAQEGLRLAGVSPGAMYISRVLINTVVLFIFQICSALILVVLLGIPLIDTVLSSRFFGLSLLVTFAYTGLSTMLAAIASVSRLGGMLLPLLLFPLLFPVLFAAIELTAILIGSGTLDLDSWWFALLASLAIMYSALGYSVFESVISD